MLFCLVALLISCSFVVARDDNKFYVGFINLVPGVDFSVSYGFTSCWRDNDDLKDGAIVKFSGRPDRIYELRGSNQKATRCPRSVKIAQLSFLNKNNADNCTITIQIIDNFIHREDAVCEIQQHCATKSFYVLGKHPRDYFTDCNPSHGNFTILPMMDC